MEPLLRRARVHVLSAFEGVPEFRARFAHFDSTGDLSELRLGFYAKTLEQLTTLVFFRLSSSSTHRFKLEEFRGKYQRLWGWRKRVARATVDWLARLGSSRALLRLARAGLRQAIRRKPQYAEARRFLVDRRITCVVSSNPLNLMEYGVLVAAQDLGIETVAIITSWDNLSSKNPYVIDFDRYLVWSPLMAEEVESYYGKGTSRIEEIGPLQFDYYFDPDQFVSREEFCQRFGFDPSRKILVYSTVTDGLMPDEPRIVERLLEALRAGEISGDPNLLVRLHPKREWKEFEAQSRDPRWQGLRVAWCLAGRPVRQRNDRWCPLDDEVGLLTNTVRHGDVDLNIFSTMLLDFAVLGKPSVLVSHDGEDRRCDWEDYEHLRPVLACKGHRIGYSFAETLAHTNAYLEKPELDEDGRRAIVEIECGRYLGRAWERLAQALAADGEGDGGAA
jgi:hypothetical protein